MDQALEGGLSPGPLSQLPELRVGPALPPLSLDGPAVLGGGVGVGGCDGVVGTGGGGGPGGFLGGVCSKGSVRAPEGDWSLIRGLEVFLDGTPQLAALDDRSVYRSPGRFLFRFLPFIEVVVELPHFFSETGVGGWGEGIGELGEFFLDFGRGCPSRRGGNRVVGLRALSENGVHYRDQVRGRDVREVFVKVLTPFLEGLQSPLKTKQFLFL